MAGAPFGGGLEALMRARFNPVGFLGGGGSGATTSASAAFLRNGRRTWP